MSAGLRSALKGLKGLKGMKGFKAMKAEMRAIRMDTSTSVIAGAFFAANLTATSFLFLKDTYYLDTYVDKVWRRHQ